MSGRAPARAALEAEQPAGNARAAVTCLRLTDFRNHHALELAPGDTGMVTLAGHNGAGKTNILEALSLFAPGRGLRRTAQGDLARAGGSGGWGIAADVTGALGEARLGTGLDPVTDADEGARRRCRVDGFTVPGAGVFSDHLRLVWLTPAMDGLFMASPGERRRFLDRLVLAIDPGHGTRVMAYERVLRARNKLLADERWDTRWLAALEREAAELGIAVASARSETVAHLRALIMEARDDASPFPWAHLAMDAEPAGGTAAEHEDRLAQRLHELRHRDRAAGRATEGPHTADLLVRHGPKDMPAHLSSTGEQKALLLGLVLAHARLVTRLAGVKPLILLDEVAAHLDPERRAALYGVLAGMGAQAWLTGADAALFGELGADAALFSIAPGQAERVR